MGLLCLVGRHGAGKSTLGRALASRGIKHLSVGLLRRLARSREFPADIPASLMAAMRRAPAGAPLPADTAQKLLRFACSFENCVLDGFPSSVEHVAMLPETSLIALLWTPARLRSERLDARAATSERKWMPGRASARESSLAAVLLDARRRERLVFVGNREKPIVEIGKFVEQIAFGACANE